MTLVQASIADNGKSVVLIADRLLTRTLSGDLPSYEFESNTPKIILRGNVGIGFAGSALLAEMSKQSLGRQNDFDGMVERISETVKSIRNESIKSEIRMRTGVSPQAFFKNPQLPIPQDVRDSIYGMMGEFNIECECIVAGFDKNKRARIAFIDSNGDVVEATPFGFISIGTGSPFSIIYFDQHGYDVRMERKEALVFAFEAKKWAEAHTGVGDKTDILLFARGREAISICDDSPMMGKLREAYDAELEKHKEMRVNLYRKVFKR